jgi:16S rRNA (cytosine1402-N4)-methyltransferase
MHETESHQPVLLREALAALRIQPDGCYVDATFGRGGHTRAMLQALGPAGRLLALDRDPAAVAVAQAEFGANERFQFRHTLFSQLGPLCEQLAWCGRVRGLLLDLGLASPQLNDARRGFSFSGEGPLDMRMDPTVGTSAAEWLAVATERELDQVLGEFGEERFHRRVAWALISARQRAPLMTTRQLAEVIAAAVPTREPGKHPATRSFQAIRIFINQELTELATVLAQTPRLLAPGGRLVVISFHSLEDRIVKRFMRTQAQGTTLPLDLPVPVTATDATLRLIARAQRPSADEVAANPRARSAVLRVAERLP